MVVDGFPNVFYCCRGLIARVWGWGCVGDKLGVQNGVNGGLFLLIWVAVAEFPNPKGHLCAANRYLIVVGGDLDG